MIYYVLYGVYYLFFFLVYLHLLSIIIYVLFIFLILLFMCYYLCVIIEVEAKNSQSNRCEDSCEATAAKRVARC